jgi:hypothetical protein
MAHSKNKNLKIENIEFDHLELDMLMSYKQKVEAIIKDKQNKYPFTPNQPCE